MDHIHHTQRALSERDVYEVAPPEGALIAHKDRVYRVTAVSPPVSDDGGGLWHWTLRPVHHEGPDEHYEGDRRRPWRRLPAHHAVCAECREPVPCRRLREQWADARAAKRARDLMSIPEGVCWHCSEAVSPRQRSVVFPGDNLFLPAGPPVTYHAGIAECRRAALDYQEKWVKAEPGREPILGTRDPFSGRPNPTQRELLALAARGELLCYGCHVYRADEHTDLNEIMAGRAREKAESRWYPYRLSSVQDRYLPPLIDAGLIAGPDAVVDVAGETRPYRLTPEGWELHRRYPPKAT